MKILAKPLIVAVATTLITSSATAQTSQERQKDSLVSAERSEMKEEIKVINHKSSNEEITIEEADSLKSGIAKRYAEKIEKKWREMRSKKTEKKEEWGRWKKRRNKKVSSDLVIAVGLNNAIVQGESIEDSPYKFLGSRFFELGWAWKRPLFKNADGMRIKYGFSIHYNGLKPMDNKYFVKRDNQILLEEFPHDLKKSKLLIKNLVLPVHFEFGSKDRYSRTVEEEGTVKKMYKDSRNFQLGIGAYGGFNMGSFQKLKYKDGSRKKEKIKGGYLASPIVYGVSAYTLFWNTAIYAKYDLSPIFKDQNRTQHNLSLGIRFDIE